MDIMQLIRMMLDERRKKEEQEQWIREQIAAKFKDQQPGLTDGPNSLEQIMRLKHPYLMKGYKRQEIDKTPGNYFGSPIQDWMKQPPPDKGLF